MVYNTSVSVTSHVERCELDCSVRVFRHLTRACMLRCSDVSTRGESHLANEARLAPAPKPAFHYSFFC